MTVTLRLRLPTGVENVEFDESTLWDSFLQKVEDISGFNKECLKILAGYPPKPLVAAGDEKLMNLVKAGDILTVQKGVANVVRGVAKGVYIPPANNKWHFVRRVCPSDNSCVFHAAAYVLRDKSRTDGPGLREECAAAVRDNPEAFTEAMLERPNREYVEWIRRPTSWGGAIELGILSFVNGIQIVALDLESCQLHKFGEGTEYTTRAFVVYTGKHYDAIAMNPMYNSPMEKEDQVLFNVNDAFVFDRAMRFVREEAENMRQFNS